MMPKLVSRMAALAVLLVALSCLWVVVVAPLMEWRLVQLTSAQQTEVELERLQASFQRLSLERETLANYDSVDLAWSARAQGEASAQIQSRMAEAASQAGIRFRSITPLPNAQRDGRNQVVFRLEFEADLAQLTAFLSEIEYATPALPVTHATLRRLVRPNEQALQPVIFAQLDIAAPVLIEDGT